MGFFEKHKKLSIIVAITFAALILMVFSALAKDYSFFAQNIFNTLVSPVQNGISAVADGIGGFFEFIGEMGEYKDENTRLSKELAELEKKYRSADALREENERLSELLELKENNLADMNTTGARVIGWSSDNWFNYYTIDKGSASGIAKKCMVVTENGLVGQVNTVGLNWSRVITIIDSSSSVGARVVRTGDIALVVGDNVYEKDGLCKMTFINQDAEIVVGDIIETSGLGGVYTAGIAIGRVKEIVADSSGASRYAVIEPMADLKNVKHVLVAVNTAEQ